MRRISLLLRQVHSAKQSRKILRQWSLWKEILRQLPSPHRAGQKKLLIVRLDDIGDYLLFRNQLGMYKQSSRWKDYSVTLLGNTSWKDLFTLLDPKTVDDAIWVDKHEYLQSASYRLALWTRLRMAGFEVVIAPSRTRPLVMDDLCMLAAAPLRAIGSENTYVHARWNRESDREYDELFRPTNPWSHEFLFNAQFSAWVCGMGYDKRRPHIGYRCQPAAPGSYVICFIGANTRSKRWPVGRWVEFITLYNQSHSGSVILAGAGGQEELMAQAIQDRTGADSIVGKVSLPQLLRWVAGAQAVLTNDTMAAHLSVSCMRPTVIIANGVNYLRFTEYGRLGIENVMTVYPDAFTQRRMRVGEGPYPYEAAVSADIASIRAARVLRALQIVTFRALDSPGPSGTPDTSHAPVRAIHAKKQWGLPGILSHRRGR